MQGCPVMKDLIQEPVVPFFRHEQFSAGSIPPYRLE
jgi:hypothetical protein